jgi:hypothetical protein
MLFLMLKSRILFLLFLSSLTCYSKLGFADSIRAWHRDLRSLCFMLSCDDLIVHLIFTGCLNKHYYGSQSCGDKQKYSLISQGTEIHVLQSSYVACL